MSVDIMKSLNILDPFKLVQSVHCEGLLAVQVAFSELRVGRHWKIPQQTEGHSFGDISKAGSVAPSGVTEARIGKLGTILAVTSNRCTLQRNSSLCISSILGPLFFFCYLYMICQLK
jgi:hypothetical protein